MNCFIKKVSVLVLSVLVLVGGSLGGVSSAYAKSFKPPLPDPYVMDRGYQKLLKYYVIGYKDKFSDALGIVEKYANSNSPRRRISNNKYLSNVSPNDSFENGYYFIQFLIECRSYLESGIYIVNIGNYYPGGSYYYVLYVGDSSGKIPSISPKSAKYPSPDPYLMNQANQKLYRYEVVGYRDDLDDALKAVEDIANEEFPKRSFVKKKNYPERHFFKNGENKEEQYKYGFKNGYEFIEFLYKYRNIFEKGYYILEMGSYYNGGYKYYIIKFY